MVSAQAPAPPRYRKAPVLLVALLAAAGIAVGSGANMDDADRSSGKLPAAEHAR